MNTFRIGTIITALLCSLSFYAQTVTGELRKWHTVTILFDGPSVSEEDDINPFLDYRLNVTFTSVISGEEFVIPGFFAADGNAAETSATSGDKWAVRFTPNQTGVWNYVASFRTGSEIAIDDDANAGDATSFDGDNGSFSISGSNKFKPDNRANGRLSYIGERYLQYEETNKYFLKAGSDSPENLLGYSDFDNTINSKDWSPHLNDWETGDPVWKNNQGKGLIGAINYLSNKGMNAVSFLTMNVNGDGKDVWPWTSSSNAVLDGNNQSEVENRLRYDVSKLEQWEVLFSHADSKGMYLHFKTQETENDQLLDGGDLGRERKLYYRELIARFAHHLSLNWNLGEEHDLYDELDDIENTLVKSYIDYLNLIDPYHHNIVIHSYPRVATQNRLYEPLLGSNLTGASLQIQINDIHEDVKRWVVASEATGKPWVVANDEQGSAIKGVTADKDYDGNKGSELDNRIDTRHQSLWGTLMAGGAGVEYYFGYQTGETDLTAEDFRSRDSKWEDAKIALDFFQEYVPFWEMDSNDNLTSDTDDYCFAKENEVYVIYLPEGGSTSLNLSNVSGLFEVKWFNPSIKGNDLFDGTITNIQGGANRNIGSPPSNSESDWVVLITKILEEESVSPPIDGCDYDYEEIDGLVLMEAENLNISSGWDRDTSFPEFTGDAHLNWQGGNNFNTPGNGLVSTSIKINTVGTYRFQWRNRIGKGDNTTEYNDSWLRFPDADDFFAVRGNSTVYPVGSGKTPNPEGASSNGWFKVYANHLVWNWDSNTSDNDPHSIYVTFDSPGVYTMEISGRSNDHLIDRIILSNDFDNPRDLSLMETLCSVNNSEVSVSSVFVSPKIVEIEISDTVLIDAEVFPSNATDGHIDWSSSNSNIASVDENGLVTSKGEGVVEITAMSRDGGHTDSSIVTIIPAQIPVRRILVAPQNFTLEQEETITLSFSITPSNASNKNVRWSSSDEEIAVVNQAGLVTAINEGEVEIIATTEDGNFESDATITVTAISVDNISVTEIIVSPLQVILDIGETSVVNTLINPSNASNKNVRWSTNDSDVATINENGLITGISEGVTFITATAEDGGVSSNTFVTVNSPTDTNIPVLGIAISPENLFLEDGDTFVLGFSIIPDNASNNNVRWSSSNVTIASVNQNGLITARREGEVNITVTSEDGGFSSMSTVTVSTPVDGNIPITRIFVQPQIVTLEAEETIQLSYEITPSNATNTEVIWSSTDESVAIVDQNGLVTAIGEGVVEIAATTEDGNRTSDSTITVNGSSIEDIPVIGINLTPEELSLEMGSSLVFNALISPGNATNKNVTWSSSDPTVASVNQEGVVTAVAIGNTVIMVRTQDGNFVAVSDVEVTEIEPITIPVTGIVINPKELSLEIETSEQLSFIISPVNASNTNVIWNSSNEKVATVNENGLVEAIAKGIIIISVSTESGNHIATIEVEVVEGQIEEVISDNVTIYPIPTSDFIEVVNLYLEEGAFVTLYSINGVVLQKKIFGEGENINMSLGSLRTGTYIIRIDNKKEIIIRKVVKR